jgi:DNA-binding GntR family transcriptional regulator
MVLDIAVVSHWYTGMEAVSTTLSAQAYTKLRSLILDGTFSPGSALSERTIAKVLETGRMPVREALRELVKDGLVQISPSRGAFVRQFAVTELRDIYEARQAVEGMATYLATKRGVTPALRACRAAFQGFLDDVENADLRAVQQAGAEFHSAIVEASRNSELSRIADSLQAQIAITLKMTVDHNPERIRVSLREHLDILDAMESGDAASAQNKMVNHLARGFEARVHIYAMFS